MITRLFDAFTDPILARFSDNARTRWGRRRPFMLVGLDPGRARPADALHGLAQLEREADLLVHPDLRRPLRAHDELLQHALLQPRGGADTGLPRAHEPDVVPRPDPEDHRGPELLRLPIHADRPLRRGHRRGDRPHDLQHAARCAGLLRDHGRHHHRDRRAELHPRQRALLPEGREPAPGEGLAERDVLHDPEGPALRDGRRHRPGLQHGQRDRRAARPVHDDLLRGRR